MGESPNCERAGIQSLSKWQTPRRSVRIKLLKMPIHPHKHLRRRDPRLGEWIDRIGPLSIPVPPVREPYVALLEAIAHQQLAGAAARAIWGRVVALFEGSIPCSKHLADMSEEQLRSAGLS